MIVIPVGHVSNKPKRRLPVPTSLRVYLVNGSVLLLIVYLRARGQSTLIITKMVTRTTNNILEYMNNVENIEVVP